MPTIKAEVQIRRGTQSTRTGIIPKDGEPLWTRDDKRIYIGDGATPGGILVGGEGLTDGTQFQHHAVHYFFSSFR
jgi:hypothetical protein